LCILLEGNIVALFGQLNHVGRLSGLVISVSEDQHCFMEGLCEWHLMPIRIKRLHKWPGSYQDTGETDSTTP
jgi:hypothetical protein